MTPRDTSAASEKIVRAFTDGACLGNPGPGGWAALLCYNGTEKELSGAEPSTTNNRMELTAVIEALSALKRPARMHIVTDSQYVKKGIEEWMPGWKKKGWKTADKKDVKNRDLWEKLDVLLEKHEGTLEWVRGHNGHAENERVDALAQSRARLAEG